MKNKGFTLIELLAVIVILAIIALIATPTILGIIENTKEESNKRSIELYADAIKNEIASFELKNNSKPTNEQFKELVNNMKYKGAEISCEEKELYEDYTFYIGKCSVNGGEKIYSYGVKQAIQIYKPQYYYFGYDWSGTVGTTLAPAELESLNAPPTGEVRYLGFDVKDGVVTAAYVCFVRNNTEYCLKGADETAYEKNQEVLEESFGTNSCSSYDGIFSCSADGIYAYENSYGYVFVNAGGVSCNVSKDNGFRCNEL